MRALKQRELGGLATFLTLIWITIGLPKRVKFNLTASTASLTTTLTTKTYFQYHEIYRHMNHNNVSIIEEEDDDHIDISVERDISYYSTPLRETPATMFHTFVAKWLVRREGMNLFVFERSRRLLSRGSMLFQPWDIWIGHTSRASQGQIYYAREDRTRNVNESAKLGTNDSALQAYHRIGSNYGHQAAARRTKKEILFDSYAADLRRASAANSTVTQDVVQSRLDEKGPSDEIAGESTWEYLQLRLTWDVWIPHISRIQIGQVYTARKDNEGRTINGQVDNTVHTGQATNPTTCTNHCCYD